MVDYPRLALPALATELRTAGARRVAVIGDLSTDVLSWLKDQFELTAGDAPDDRLAAGEAPARDLDAVVVGLAPSSDSQALEVFDRAHSVLAPSGQLLVVMENTRHFFDIAAAAFDGSLESGEGQNGIPVSALSDLLAESGFIGVQVRPVRLGYGPRTEHRPTSYQMGDISERDPGRIATLAHAVLAVAVRGDASGIPRYDSDELATLWEAGNLDKAAAYLDGFFLNNGGRPRIWSDAAVILADAGMIDEALNCVRRAISCDPFHEAARENLWYLLERPRTEEPERLCLLEMDPALAVQNVETLMSIGREEGALNWAETAFMRRPDATSAAALVRVLRALNRPSQAGEVSSLLRLLAAGRTDPSVPPQH